MIARVTCVLEASDEGDDDVGEAKPGEKVCESMERHHPT